MSEFLRRSACRGRRPSRVASTRHVSRPDLLARLLGERHVPRYLVAPDGFGKTNLALEYADTIFSFEHVFWIEGKSPCFLRDLDAGTMAEVLLAADDEPFLAVIEDVPALDPPRAAALIGQIDVLLDRDCEVLVTCLPTRDVFERQRDRIRLSALDLLLNDEELDAMRLPSACASEPAPLIPQARRVAGLAWGPEDGGQAFLEGVLHEDLPSDVALALFVMLMLGEGDFADVAAFGPFDAAQARLVAERYPYVGVDLHAERFRAAPFREEHVVAAFSRAMDRIAKRSVQGSRNLFSTRLADALAARRDLERACGLVRLLAGRPARATWLADQGAALFEGVCLLPASEVYRSLGTHRSAKAPALAADEAARRALLGDKAGACAAAHRAGDDAATPPSVRAVGLLVLAMCGDEQTGRRARAQLEMLVKAACAQARAAGGQPPEWEASVEVYLALGRSCAEAIEVWEARFGAECRSPDALISASWVLRQVVAAQGGEPEEDAAAIERFGFLVRAAVGDARGQMGLSCALAGSAFERACRTGPWRPAALGAEASLSVRRIELSLYAQRTACENAEQERDTARRAAVVAHPDLARVPARGPEALRAVSLEPMLTVNLFGGLEVRIGGVLVEPRRFRRSKAQTLLVLLTLNNGHELSRGRLLELLWPESDADHALKSFYAVWSDLRRALTTPSGTCPYLIRRQQGFRLDPALLESDVQQLDDVCRELLFERPGYGGWAYLYEKVDRQFSEELVPGVDDNVAIDAMRMDYRNRLVDALVAAATRLTAAGDVQEGLWFARAAVQRDQSREDAYVALMRAQMAAGQRAAALETYFSCRRFLAEELGIDPAVETVELYRRIIEAEERL